VHLGQDNFQPARLWEKRDDKLIVNFHRCIFYYILLPTITKILLKATLMNDRDQYIRYASSLAICYLRANRDYYGALKSLLDDLTIVWPHSFIKAWHLCDTMIEMRIIVGIATGRDRWGPPPGVDLEGYSNVISTFSLEEITEYRRAA